jgi:hypothetical protein
MIQFERVYVINLRRRPDRLRAFWERLKACQWPFGQPIVYPAIEGDKVGVPPEFTQGGGAYGCRMSHLRILQDCLMEDVPSVLILEDDADFRPDFGPTVQEFLARVPDDWEGIMLGGQHHVPPVPVREGVVRVRNAQRTHAYAARGRYLRCLQQRWGNATVHIDWLMRDWQHQFLVYAPSRWLVGQAGGRSDIRGAEKPKEWWLPPSGQEPVVILRAPRLVMEALRDRGWHSGMERDPATGLDLGLIQCFEPGLPPAESRDRLHRWIHTVQWECTGGGMVCTLWHPEARLEMVQAAWSGPVMLVEADSIEAAEAQLPESLRQALAGSATVRLLPIVLLDAPRPVVERLLELGWHIGYWRNPETGIDRGLERIMGPETPPDQRVGELAKWCIELRREAVRDGKILAVWHPEIDETLLARATADPVIPIRARSVDDAIAQWQKTGQ